MRFKGLDLNLLFVLDCLLEESSVSRAAERLHVTQPAMSAALKRLREYFGDALLVADGKRMVPTPKAVSLRGEVRALLGTVEAILAAGGEFDPSSARQTFRVAASDYAIAVTFAAMLERWNIEAPEITIEFHSPTDESYGRFEQGEIDLIVGPEPLILPDHPSEFLYEERQVVAGWSGNPAFHQKLGSDAFYQAEHVAVQIGSGSRNSIAEAHLRKVSIHRKITVTAHSFAIVPALLINTNRLAVVHERLAEWSSRHLPIAFTSMPFDFPKSRMMVQYHRSRQKDASLKWLVSQLRKAVDDFWSQ